jgi:hypothetical protein
MWPRFYYHCSKHQIPRTLFQRFESTEWTSLSLVETQEGVNTGEVFKKGGVFNKGAVFKKGAVFQKGAVLKKRSRFYYYCS